MPTVNCSQWRRFFSKSDQVWPGRVAFESFFNCFRNGWFTFFYRSGTYRVKTKTLWASDAERWCQREWRTTLWRRRYGIRGMINFVPCVSQSLCVKIFKITVRVPLLFASTFIYSTYNVAWAWRPLFRVSVVFFAIFLKRSMSRPRQTTWSFRKELKDVPN